MNEGAVFGILCCALSPLLLAVLPFVIGYSRRRRTMEDVAAREARVAHLVTANTAALGEVRRTVLVIGNVAYAADAPSVWAAGWRNLVGGSMESLRTQTDLARRLATVRALEQAAHAGAAGVVNLRFETSELNSSRGRQQGTPIIEILAYGTAWLPVDATHRPTPPGAR
ncbi:MAG: heavy metal-binding domain-containing protein [Micromonosporaceae bacterium]